jgi:hypothetical protein
MTPEDFRLRQIQRLFEEREIEFSIHKFSISRAQLKNLLKLPAALEYCSRFRADISKLVLQPFFCLKLGNTHAFIDQELDFNRYRGIALNSEFYKDWKAFKALEFKVYSKKYEGECAKLGHKNGIWSSKESDLVFGKSAKTGDLGFSSGGSSGWKLLAIRNLLLDLYFYTGQRPFIRVSIYDKIMLNARLHTFGELLRNGDNDVITKFLNRKISEVHV